MKKRKRRIIWHRLLLLVFICIALIVALGFAASKVFYHPLKLNGDKEITIGIHETYKDAGVNVEDASIEGNVNTDKEGTYTITYTYKNRKVERTVHVIDNSRITLTIKGDKDTIVRQGDPYIESGVSSYDKKEGDLTDTVEMTGEVDTETPGEYSIVYRSTNSEGLVKEVTRTVHVISKDKFKKNTKGVPVCMYHYLYTKDKVPEELNTNYLLDTEFEQHLQYLKDNNYYFPSYEELRAYVDGKIALPEKSIVLTFDDGQSNFFKYAIPLLEKYEVPATSFIIGISDGDKKVSTHPSSYVTYQSHSYDMHHGGGNIGHGGIISAMSQEEITEDLLKNQKIVHNTEAFAYPYGDITEDAKKAVNKAGILCAFTTQYGRVEVGDDPMELVRIRVLGDASLEGFIASIE